nr:MAG TPA: hypothetical protein [Caudoviricetes sp.]
MVKPYKALQSHLEDIYAIFILYPYTIKRSPRHALFL